MPKYERKPGKQRAKPPNLLLNSSETLEFVKQRDKDFKNVAMKQLAQKIRNNLPF